MSSNEIRLYRVKGTHYECGHSIGKLTQEAIRTRIADDIIELTRLFKFVNTDFGKNLHRCFIETICAHYPWYWDEIRGIADGSQIPLEQILVLNFLNETSTALSLFEEQHLSIEHDETGSKGCSTVLINRKDSNILSLLHNEDHSRALFRTAYLIEADIQSSKYDNDKRECPNEKFLSYSYAGCLPGNAFSVNQHGFACTLNGLYPNHVGYGRLPRQIVNRALLSIRNENELDQLFRSAPVAFGFCVNGGFFHQKQYLLNYEIGPNINIDNENYVSKCLIIYNQENIEKEDNSFIASNYLVHYNHYERLNNVIAQRKHLQSTYRRWQRGQELGEIKNINDAKNLLGDNTDQRYPIFRDPNRTDFNSVTLCTVHIDFNSSKLLIYRENPKENIQPIFTYDLFELFTSNINN